MIASDFLYFRPKNRTLAEHARLEFEVQLRHLLLPRLEVNHPQLLPDRGTGNVSAAIAYARRMYGPFFLVDPPAMAEVANAFLSKLDHVGVTAHLDALQANLARDLDLRRATGERAVPLRRNAAVQRPGPGGEVPDRGADSTNIRAGRGGVDRLRGDDDHDRHKHVVATHALVTERVYRHWARPWEKPRLHDDVLARSNLGLALVSASAPAPLTLKGPIRIRAKQECSTDALPRTLMTPDKR